MAVYNFYGSYSIGKNAKSGRARLQATTSETATTMTIKLDAIAEKKSGYTLNYGYNSHLYSNNVEVGSASESSTSNSYPRTLVTKSPVYSKTTSPRTIPVKHILSSKWTDTTYTSTASGTITIPALASYAVTYNANTTDTVTGMPSNQTKWYGYTLTLSGATPIRSGYAFIYWNTSADGTGTTYYQGGSYAYNTPLTLYAIWKVDTPPSFDVDEMEIGGYKQGDNAIVGLSTLSCEAKNIVVAEGRSVKSVTLYDGDTLISTKNSSPYSFSITPSTAGTSNYRIVVMDSDDLPTSKGAGTITVVNPTWTGGFTVNQPPPSFLTDGEAVLEDLQLMKSDGTYESVNTKIYVTSFTPTSWTFNVTFDADHVDTSNDVVNPDVGVKMIYMHYDSYEKEYRRAFFETTRNQNFSNGIYNTIFVSGVSPSEQPNYSSRVWWSEVNDPLYFPDTNYAEVGSNDTAVMGLAKVGSYLGAIKQSKTTDTAIYLLYPTSFEEDTTYAVKQGVQGVGAIGKYTFNILGDETLFLSPNGVMAIVPSEDEEHRVQNRSFYVDGRLLKEPNLEDAFSFVYDGKYWLSVNGNCYVLDGNQRNSWGNDKTNLVYECYYLENIPARSFAKFGGRLVFSDTDNVCVFNETYIDAYDGDEQDVPVSATWSTIFDDDNSLHYFKTMQKKGNLISILPTDISYVIAEVDETTFNADKKLYYTQDADGNYIHCTSESVYDENATYFVRGRSNTKVFVKKDDKDLVEIQRKFGESSTIPSEMFFNKKFKKYKRLQFIITNSEPEPFGIDEIVKNYTVGNYAKK